MRIWSSGGYMKNIQVKILNPEAVKQAEKMMVFTARLTQRGHTIKNMNDIDDLLNKDLTT